MRIQTQGNSNKVWLSSDTGVIEGTMIMSAPTLEKILQAVNEKYGTSFESWSQLPTVYEVGGNVPNWNAYEKMSSVRYAIAFSNDLSVFGVVENTAFKVSCNGENFYMVDGITGEIYSQQYYGSDFMNMLMSKLNAAGVHVSTMEKISISYEIGTMVPDWYLYKLIR